uniref:Uncharacterized protein n=1 Tax=Plectus sambesii TaxID=2011161 RepID=A0A914WHN3_9BILA
MLVLADGAQKPPGPFRSVNQLTRMGRRTTQRSPSQGTGRTRPCNSRAKFIKHELDAQSGGPSRRKGRLARLARARPDGCSNPTARATDTCAGSVAVVELNLPADGHATASPLVIQKCVRAPSTRYAGINFSARLARTDKTMVPIRCRYELMHTRAWAPIDRAKRGQTSAESNAVESPKFLPNQSRERRRRRLCDHNAG